MQKVFRQNLKTSEKKVGFIAGLFGCWHQLLSRPFTPAKGESYRVCLDCGARRQFNPETLETYGPFYFSPSSANVAQFEHR
jgi:hypothetical protein